MNQAASKNTQLDIEEAHRIEVLMLEELGYAWLTPDTEDQHLDLAPGKRRSSRSPRTKTIGLLLSLLLIGSTDL